MSTPMNPITMKRKEYADKVDAFEELRAKGRALQVVKNNRKALATWKPSNFDGTRVDKEKVQINGRNIGSIVSYFDNYHSAALECLYLDKFEVQYQVHYDLDRTPVLGQNTMTINVPVKWEKLPVEVGLYAGSQYKVLAREELTSAAREGLPNREALAKVTGWSRIEMQQFPATMMQSMKNLISQAIVGQHKMTRLVKGFLLLLETMDRGRLSVGVDVNTLLYTPQAIVASYDIPGRAYIWNSKPDSLIHTAVLSIMGSAYPPPEYGSHVNVPADGKSLWVVSQGNPSVTATRAVLLPSSIYASMLTYAMDTNCTGLLQQALMIACSLQQNRYFSKVRLPAVVSNYDLLAPSYVRENTMFNKPVISREMGKALGRLHQMLNFIAAKDVITSANMQSKQGFDPNRSVQSYLNSNAILVSRMAEFISPMPIMESTKQLQIFNVMEPADYQDLMGISILEGMWLASTAKKCVHNGVISSLIDGIRDLTPDNTTYHVLVHEIKLAGVKYEEAKLAIPLGSFSVSWVNLSNDIDVTRRDRGVRTIHNEFTKECDYVPPRKRFATKVRIPQEHMYPTKVLKPVGPTKVATVVSPPPTYERITRISPVFSDRSSQFNSSDNSNQPKVLGFEVERKPAQYNMTKMAEEAASRPKFNMQKLVDSIKEKEENNAVAEKTEKLNLEKIVGDMSGQMTAKEAVTKKLQIANLSGKEVSQWLVLLDATLGLGSVAAMGGIDSIIARLDSKGIIDYPRVLDGGSKYAKAVNKLIIKGNANMLVTDNYSVMRSIGSQWMGAKDDEVDPQALRFVKKSIGWELFMEDHAMFSEGMVPRGTVTTTSTARLRDTGKVRDLIPDLIVGYTGLIASDVPIFSEWLCDTSRNLFPLDITHDDMRELIEVPDSLDWYKHPSSLSARSELAGDSRWLLAAAHLRKLDFDINQLKTLCGQFRVPRYIRESLKEKYGLFEKDGQN